MVYCDDIWWMGTTILLLQSMSKYELIHMCKFSLSFWTNNQSMAGSISRKTLLYNDSNVFTQSDPLSPLLFSLNVSFVLLNRYRAVQFSYHWLSTDTLSPLTVVRCASLLHSCSSLCAQRNGWCRWRNTFGTNSLSSFKEWQVQTLRGESLNRNKRTFPVLE